MGFPILIICYPSEPFILILAKVIFVIYFDIELAIENVVVSYS